MEIAKPTDADRAWFHSLVPDDPRVEAKPMFGNLGAFVNGNMFMGLFGPDVGLRLDPAGREQLGAVEGSAPFGPAERPMREYVAVPRAWRDDPEKADPWVGRALEHTAGMPPKRPKRRKRS